MEEKWLVPKQVAGKLGVSYKTVFMLIKTEQLLAYRIGRHYKIKPLDLEKFIQNNKTNNG